MNFAIATLIIALPALAGAQATVEAAAGMSRAATSVGGSGQKIGKGIGGAMDKLNRTLQDSEKDDNTSKKTTVVTPAARGSRKAAETRKPDTEKVAEVHYEPPSGIREGIEVAELTRRFGPPALKISSGMDQQTYCYVDKDGVNIDVTVKAGKVASVLKQGDSSPSNPPPAVQK